MTLIQYIRRMTWLAVFVVIACTILGAPVWALFLALFIVLNGDLLLMAYRINRQAIRDEYYDD